MSMEMLSRLAKVFEIHRRRLAGCCVLVLLAAAWAGMAAAPAAAQRERAALNITGYVINAELDTATHHLTATTVVSFTAPANLDVVNFGFHPALRVTKITDGAEKCSTESGRRTGQSG